MKFPRRQQREAELDIDRLPFAPALAISKFVAEGQPPEVGKEPLTQMRGKVYPHDGRRRLIR